MGDHTRYFELPFSNIDNPDKTQLNSLSIIVEVLEEHEPDERQAILSYLNSRYGDKEK